MSAKLSTGLRDHLLVTGSLKAALDGMVMYIYGGTPPASANAALSGNTLLCIVSDDATGAGLNMAATPASGVLGKNSGQIWRGEIVGDGIGTFYRMASLTDDGLESTTALRLQGTVGVVDADLNFANITFVSGNFKNVDSFNVAQPTA